MKAFRLFTCYLSIARASSTFRNLDGFPKHQLNNDGVFTNPWGNHSIMDALKMTASMKYRKLPLPDEISSVSLIKSVPIDLNLLSNSNQPHYTWLGHASGLYQVHGSYFLTDPMFSKRASISQYFGPRRLQPPPIAVQSLPVDVVLLSHTHYDHMDANTIRQLGNGPLWIVPLGVRRLLRESFGVTNCVELGWWEEFTYDAANGQPVKIIFTPSKHWTQRSLFDKNTCLWGGFCVISPTSSFFFSGDTAYDQALFQLIGAKYGPFDLASLAIGAYSPRWFMRHVHCDPNDACLIHHDLKAKKSVGIHWGTFVLTEEDPIEPALELARVRVNHNISHLDFFTMAIGETVSTGEHSSNDFVTTYPHLFPIYLNWINKHKL